MISDKTLKEVQAVLLDLTDAFIDFCNEHNLQWFADSGTLLGAVREGGIIPWDDDIDVAMPREDYNRLLEMTKGGRNPFPEPYFLQTLENDSEYSSYMQLRNTNTTKLRRYELNGYCRQHKKFLSNKGISIDILPIDLLPNEANRRLTLGQTFNFIQNYYCIRTVTYIDWNRYLSIKRFKQALFMYEDVIMKIKENAKTLRASKQLKYAFVSTWTGTGKFYTSCIEKECFESYIEFDFKGLRNKMRVPCMYDKLLTIYYGDDYMTPDRNGAFHDNTYCIYDVNRSFHEYEPYGNKLLRIMIDRNMTLDNIEEAKSLLK